MIKYSIIIPTLNQSAKLKKCLSCLADLYFNASLFEVLVIDNGSTDDTKEMAFQFKAKIENLRYIFCESPGLMAARHRGADEANGEIICYIDDDSLVDKNWLQAIEESFSNEEVVLVGGPCIPEYEADPPEWVEYFWRDTSYGKINTFLSLLDFGNSKLLIDPRFIYGCNFSIRKKKFYELGGTHPDYLPERYKKFQGDGESGMKDKIEFFGYKSVYNPLAKINHLIPVSRLTVDYFCKRAYFNGIHTSYKEVRNQHGTKKISLGRGAVRIICKKIRDKKNLILSNDPNEIKEIKKKISNSHRQGYSFHQQEVKKDPKLLEWVLRENYLGNNGVLPL